MRALSLTEWELWLSELREAGTHPLQHFERILGLRSQGLRIPQVESSAIPGPRAKRVVVQPIGYSKANGFFGDCHGWNHSLRFRVRRRNGMAKIDESKKQDTQKRPAQDENTGRAQTGLSPNQEGSGDNAARRERLRAIASDAEKRLKGSMKLLS